MKLLSALLASKFYDFCDFQFVKHQFYLSRGGNDITWTILVQVQRVEIRPSHVLVVNAIKKYTVEWW